MAFIPSVWKKTKTMADGEFQREFLDTHNAYRQKHGAPPMTLSRELCRSAQEWADELLGTSRLRHSNSDDLGENLFCLQSSGPTVLAGKTPVEEWYNEIKKYDFKKPRFQSGTGHFTQVVWKESRELGVGLATDGRTFFVVGQYSPAGNVNTQSHFQKNVLPAGSPAGSVGPAGKTTPAKSAHDFQREALESHNRRRQQHGVPPLTLNLELCDESQKWAEHLVAMNTLEHSDTDLGENIWYKYSSNCAPVSGEEPVDSWYAEIKKYNFSKPGYQNSTGHFTQVVWKASEEMGIAKATDGKGKVIVVARYQPAGNITNPGYYENNVLRARIL